MVEIIGYVSVFISGLFIGSFLNVVADRVSKGGSPLKGRSHCDHCKENLRPKDLVPLLSYVSLKGKCRYCKKSLSFYYPLSELITGLTFFGIAYYLKIFSEGSSFSWINFAYVAITACFLIVLFLTDVKYKLIPNKVVYPAIIYMLLVIIVSFVLFGLAFYNQLKADPFGQYLLQVGYWHDQMWVLLRRIILTLGSSLGLAFFFWLLILVTRGKGMGGGDVKLAFLIGLINMFPLNIVAIVLAFVSGALFSIVLMVLKRKGIKDIIPFGPFMILGCVVAFIYGQQLLTWYTGLI